MTTTEVFQFDREKLLGLAQGHRAEYAAARPFAHVVLDDFCPEWILDEVLTEFPSPEEAGWKRFGSDNERSKLTKADEAAMGPATRQLLAEFNSATFIDFLGELTGIAGLVPDPYYEGGGLHQSLAGGHLNIHVDFNRHPATGLDRRLNVLLYLNREWEEEWGGALELWSPDMQRCEQRIAPHFNRLVVFSTTERSFHGHPRPLACPPDRTRRSLALYYYSNGRPEERGAAAPTHNTVWGEPGVNPVARRERVKEIVRLVTPPILLDAAREARRRRSRS
ncbi:MAG TPA: 2OG-Fe(II) oxygenase [Solirubrobacteraceae bacterium]|nr:2OG-Fe(II) oxygenase [Solirubrobacteraceae bacterium]